jgi:hypothetical protein
MTQIPIRLYDGHILFAVEDKTCLLDTGSHISIGNSADIHLFGRAFPLSDGLLNLNTASLSEYIGTLIDVLIGGDVLKDYRFTVDLHKNQITFTDEESADVNADYLELDLLSHVPIVLIEIGGEELRVVWDTGAKITYLPERLAAEGQIDGTIDDFYPGFTRFTTQFYRTPVSIGRHQVLSRCGTLPAGLTLMLDAFHIGGIVGNDLLGDLQPTFDYTAGRVYVKRHEVTA